MNTNWNDPNFQGFKGQNPFHWEGHAPKPRKAIGTPFGRTVLNLAITLVFAAAYFYIALPPINLKAPEFYAFALLVCGVYGLCAVLTSGFQGSGVRGYFKFLKKQCLIPLALAVLFALGNAAIGFIDDYCKLVKHQNEGLTERQKLLLQLVLTAAYLAMLRASGHLETSLRIPFTDMRLELSWFAYPVYLLVMVGFVNATNLTDGLDGLASSVCATVAAFTLLLAVWRRDADSTVLAATLLAGMLGFLVFNHHPAQMFMGDTGSLFLGGVIMGCAMMAGELLLFVLAGFVFVADMLTSLLQRWYFRLTHGKRLFPIAPIHHSFEKWGFGEYAVMGLFAGVSALFCVLAWFGK